MWSTTASNKKVALAALSVACFNTHAELDVDSIIQTQSEIIYSSNIAGELWSSVGTVQQTEPHKVTTDILGINDIVELVKVGLGLPNKDIANIFRVTRQTLHSYKNPKNEHTVNSSNKERALILSEIVSNIRPKFERSPGAMAKNYMIDGKSLLDLLSEPKLDINEILHFANKLSEKMSSEAPKASPNSEVSLHQLTKVS